MDGDECMTPGERVGNVCLKFATFAQAQQTCTDLGRRLCTPVELEDNLCCHTGCGFDYELIWQNY